MLQELTSKPLKARVAHWLTVQPSNRDNDMALLANIWKEEFIAMHGAATYAKAVLHGFLGIMANKKLSSPESVRRLRQKVQEEQPELRGSTYKVRQKHSNEVRMEINKY